MASNSKVFVSPGVYTSERDLSFVSQSVGVTTLGIVGETIKGPAFEPIFITSFDEFEAYFGGTLPEKFVNTQIPKYEAAYIAKSYLQQSNQLFVTRVLGLSGYDAGPSWSIQTEANVNPRSVGFDYLCETIPNISAGTCDTSCTAKTLSFDFQFTGCSDSEDSIVFLDLNDFPEEIRNILDSDYTQFDGGVSTLSSDIKKQLLDIFKSTGTTSASSAYYWGTVTTEDYNILNSIGRTGTTNVMGVSNVSSDEADLSSSINDAWYYHLFNNYDNDNYSGFSFWNIVSDLVLLPGTGPTPPDPQLSDVCFTVKYLDPIIGYEAFTVNPGPALGGKPTYTFTTTDPIYTLFAYWNGSIWEVRYDDVLGNLIATIDNPDVPVQNSTYSWTTNNDPSIDIFNSYLGECIDPCDVPPVSPLTPVVVPTAPPICFSGTASGKLYYYTGDSFSEYNNLVVATLRSRGLSNFDSSNNGPKYEVDNVNNVILDFTGTYQSVKKNPFSSFAINIINCDGKQFVFKTSMKTSDANYIGKVFGLSNFSKPRKDVPLFLEERFDSLLDWAYKKGYIKGLRSELVKLKEARSGEIDNIAYYAERYQSPETPWVVSELRGTKIYKLFKFISIADGNSANDQLKISIINISFNNQTFDVIVRDFYDTDDAPVVLEKFTNCSMDIGQNNFIAKKIGSSNGEFALNSKFIMVEMNEDAPVDALPCGFEGYKFRKYDGVRSPFPIYKTKYDFPGEKIFNPPFGDDFGNDDPVTTTGDNVRRTYLGLSDKVGYDLDFFQYFGKQNLGTVANPKLQDWDYMSKGFHMDIDANVVKISDNFSTSGSPAFEVGSAEFRGEPEQETNPYYRLFARKFTLFVAGGFDGWDIYREYRTNSDRFLLGKSGYLAGASPDDRYPNATGSGLFRRITVGDNKVDWANTDYYAYLLGQRTFINPEAVNINVFVTPGIDYVNNSNLVESAIDMIENNRADSIYITTTPDYNMFTPTTSDTLDLIYPQEAVDNLEETGIDSNYTATYYPWVLTRDSVNNTQIYIPATAEVTRNLALTDNIAFPWFAAAGYTRGLVNAIKARRKLTQEDRDVLYQGRINPIATFSDVGTVIWGNKTLQIRESALDRINVRRLLLQARKLISAVSVRLLFEQNDERVRQDFLDAVNPILDGIRRDRGLYDFRVTVSSSPEDLDRNQLVGKIYIKPTKALEFIDIEFLITPTGASFENI